MEPKRGWPSIIGWSRHVTNWCEQMLAENVNKDGWHGSKQECVWQQHGMITTQGNDMRTYNTYIYKNKYFYYCIVVFLTYK